MILTAIALLIQTLPAILQATGVVSPALAKLITQLGAAIPGLITALGSNQSVPDKTLDLLAAFRTELQTLSAETNLSPHALGLATTLTLAINNALQGYQAAQVKDDPTTLSDLPTNLGQTAPEAALQQAVQQATGTHAAPPAVTAVATPPAGNETAAPAANTVKTQEPANNEPATTPPAGATS